jgi:hypothetical protein
LNRAAYSSGSDDSESHFLIILRQSQRTQAQELALDQAAVGAYGGELSGPA